MRCREASIGAIVQVVVLALGTVSGSPLGLLAGLAGGVVAGLASADRAAGLHNGTLAGATGLAGFALSVAVVTVLAAPPAAPGLPTVIAGAVVVLAGATAGGLVGVRSRERLARSPVPMPALGSGSAS